MQNQIFASLLKALAQEYGKKCLSELTNNKRTPNTRRVNLEGDFVLAETK